LRLCLQFEVQPVPATAGKGDIVNCTCVVVASLLLAAHGTCLAATPLNDSGQLTCYDDEAATGTVSPGTPDPEADGFNAQDCTRGSAAADALGVMYKIGGSSVPGRDYSKIANDGSELPANASLGSAATDWACTRDNVTGLIWEIKVNDWASLRHMDYTYSWYDADGSINGGNTGVLGGYTCMLLPSNQCNTTAFRDAVNALTGSDRLCGASDWRLPSAKELQSLVHYGTAAAPRIDNSWFPNTAAERYWSGGNFSPSESRAWFVEFWEGGLIDAFKGFDLRVRLVRDGQ
jgi:hypothetical protein